MFRKIAWMTLLLLGLASWGCAGPAQQKTFYPVTESSVMVCDCSETDGQVVSVQSYTPPPQRPVPAIKYDPKGKVNFYGSSSGGYRFPGPTIY